ncbi:ComEC/Rec2 family competence protein [uncultured Arcticibacterium sp.]|uniref:ComEC/Rec2 family competence protein n=1 Tax=uncultured Arcticibacterium sp. TaxID=2173042 RepID=UPI0030F8AF62
MELRAYPYLRLVLFLIIGIYAYEYQFLSETVFLLIAATAAVFFTLGYFFTKANILQSLGIYTLLFCLGFGAAQVSREKQSKDSLSELDSYMVRVNGAVETKPKSFKAIAEVLKTKNDSIWKQSKGEVLLYFTKELDKPKYGDIYLINNSPREIEGPKNPFEFNYKTFQNRRGIQSHHFLRKDDFIKLGHKAKYPILAWSYKLNEQCGNILNQKLNSKAGLAVAEAMLLGTKDELDNETRDAYATAGAVHILAVSGLHVGILMLMLNFLFSPLKRKPILFGILTVTLLWAYAVFTGLSPSVTRATLMFSLFQLGTMFKRDKNSINVLAGSAFLLLLFKPFWLFEVGFQLSYLAIFGIIYLFPYLNKLYEPKNWLLAKLWQISIVSIAAQLFTFPLSIYYFHQFPNYFLLTNPIVTVMSFAVLFVGILSLILTAAPLISDILYWILNFVLDLLNKCIFLISSLPESKALGFSISQVEVVLLYSFLFCVILFFLKKDIKFFLAAFILLAGLSFWNISEDLNQSKQKALTYHFIPKSSGVSIIQAKSAVFLTDSTTANNPRAYDFHLKNYYDNKGIQDYKIVSPEKENTSYTFEVAGSKNLWIRKFYRGKVSEEFNRILVSNNAVYDLEKQFNTYPKQIILDDSNSKYRISKLKNQADSLGINLISLYESGGTTFNY